MQIKNRQRFSLSPFAAGQMRELGQVVLDSIKARMHAGLTVEDAPAPALKPVTHTDRGGQMAALIPYEVQKIRKGRQPIRDLTNTGALMASLQVVSASDDRAAIACDNPVKDAVLHRNQRRSPQFGLSPTDRSKMQRKVRAMLERNIRFVAV